MIMIRVVIIVITLIIVIIVRIVIRVIIVIIVIIIVKIVVIVIVGVHHAVRAHVDAVKELTDILVLGQARLADERSGPWVALLV